MVPQSDETVVFTATTMPVDGDTDTNPGNDRLETEILIGQRTVELRVAGLTTPDAPVAGQPMEAVATISNDGPDDSRGMVVDLTAYGDVQLGPYDESCVEVPLDLPFAAVELRCEPEPLAALAEGTVTLPLVPQSEGLVFIEIRVQTAVTEDQDADRSNNSVSVNVNVGPGGS